MSQRIVLIDDDRSFCKIMASFAKARGIDLDFFYSLEHMGSIGFLAKYQIAIVDYDLGSINGIEIAAYLPAFFGKMPMILVSGQYRQPQTGETWPGSLKEFIHKDLGPNSILDAALRHIVPINVSCGAKQLGKRAASNSV